MATTRKENKSSICTQENIAASPTDRNFKTNAQTRRNIEKHRIQAKSACIYILEHNEQIEVQWVPDYPNSCVPLQSQHCSVM